jgi:hypothetical protein
MVHGGAGKYRNVLGAVWGAGKLCEEQESVGNCRYVQEGARKSREEQRGAGRSREE